MEIKLLNCFYYVIPTINFPRIKILLVSLLFFIVKYVFETVCEIIDGKMVYTLLMPTYSVCKQISFYNISPFRWPYIMYFH